MAPRITLPGGGAIDLDVQEARILNVGLLEVEEGITTQTDVDNSAAPRSYINRGDVRFYDATTSYVTNDYVLFNNRIWFANEDVMGTPPQNEAGDIATQWSELTRQDLFLRFTVGGTTFSADAHNDTVTFVGGTGIDASADADTDTVTFALNATIDNLMNVDTTGVADGEILVYDEDQARWVTAENSALPSFRLIQGSGSSDPVITATGTLNRLNFISSTVAGSPVTTEVGVAANDDNTAVNISVNTTVDNAVAATSSTPGTPGLLTGSDKQLLDEVRDEGYANTGLRIGADGVNLTLDDNSISDPNNRELDRQSLDNFLALRHISDVSDTILPRTDQILQWDGTQWDAVTLEPGDYEFPTSAGSDAIRLEPGDYFIQNRIRYRYTGITNSGITTRSVAAEAVIPQSILNSTEFERVGLQTAYHTFPITLDTFIYRGDIVVHENVPYMFLGISTATDGTVSDVDSLPVPANTTISAAQFEANFLTLSRTPRSYTIPSGNPDETVTIYRGDVLIQDNVPYMWLGVGGPATALVAEDSKVIQTNSRIAANFLAEHYLTLNSNTTYTLATNQNDGENFVSITLDDGDSETTDSSFNLIGGDNITLDRTDEGDIRIRGADISTEHFPIYNAATLYELGDIIIYEFPRGSIQAEDLDVDPSIPAAPPRDAFLQVQFAGNSGTAVPVGGRVAQEPIRSGQTGINAVSRDWKIPANSISVFHPWLQYSVNAIVDYEGALYRSLTDVIRPADGVPLPVPSATNTDWTSLDISTAAVVAGMSPLSPGNVLPIFSSGIARPEWDNFNRTVLGYPLEDTSPTGVDINGQPGIVGNATQAQVRSAIDAAWTDRPLAVWAENTDYAINDQVLRDGGSNVNSIYICYVAHNSGTAESSRPENNQDQWHLVRSGIVSVQGPDDIGPAGITNNSTLHLNEGSGINVTRNGTEFTITARGSGHSDADDFGPGYMYNFASVRGGFDSGRVLATQATITVDNISGTGDDTLTLSAGTSRTFEPSTYYGIRLNGDDLRAILPNYPDVGTADIILYGISDPFGNDDLTVLQLDPPVASGNTIIGYADLPGTGAGRNPNRALTFLQLEPTHDTQHEPAVWAREGNTDQIPDAKLENVNQTVGVTRTAGATEELVFNVDGTSTLTLDTEPDVINDLDDVNLTAPTDTAIDQVLRYDNTTDPANPVWVNADLDLPIGSRFRFSPTTATSNNVEITGFITDNDLDTETFTTVRSANIPTGGRLQFELARFMSMLQQRSSFPASPAWDQPWSDPALSLQRIAEVGLDSNGEDELFPDEHLETLSTTASNIAISGNPRARGNNNEWEVTYTDNTAVQPTSTTLAGGSVPDIPVTATTNTGENTSTAIVTGPSWQTASFTSNNPRVFGSTRTFLQSYPNYTWTVRANNVINTNSCELQFFTFPNGTTTYSFTGSSGTITPSLTSLTIGGVGNVTFTSTLDIWNNGSLPDDSITGRFVRPEAVTGTSYPVVFNRSQSGFPPFTYPLFSLSRDDGTTIPTVTEWIAGTQSNASTNRTRSINIDGIRLNNTAGTETRYLWVAYPTGAAAFTRVTFVATVNGITGDPITVTLDSDIQRSSTDVSLQGAGAPDTSSEDYQWFWLEIPAGNDIVLSHVS